MSKFAIIKTTGKQYRVDEGKVLTLDAKLGEIGAVISFPEILLMSENDTTTVGAPLVAGAIVEGEIVSTGRGTKIRVVKYKPKIRYRRVTGHRQDQTKIKITNIKTS